MIDRGKTGEAMSSPGRRRRSGPAQSFEGTGRRAAGELEDDVLAALWSGSEPMTPAQVHEAIGGDLAYTTVLTILSRLLAKGSVERMEAGRTHAYWPTVDPDARAAEQMRRLLERRGDRSAVLAHFVEGLSRADGRLLRKILRRE